MSNRFPDLAWTVVEKEGEFFAYGDLGFEYGPYSSRERAEEALDDMGDSIEDFWETGNGDG